MLYVLLLQITLKETASKNNGKTPFKQSCPFPYLFLSPVFFSALSQQYTGRHCLPEIAVTEIWNWNWRWSKERQGWEQIGSGWAAAFKHKPGQKACPLHWRNRSSVPGICQNLNGSVWATAKYEPLSKLRVSFQTSRWISSHRFALHDSRDWACDNRREHQLQIQKTCINLSKLMLK